MGQKFQIVVPASLREAFLTYAHDNPLSGHLGKFKTPKRLLDFAYWPTMRNEVWQHCKLCKVCQQYKTTNLKPAGELQNVSIVEPGHMLGMDIIVPFPRSTQQNDFILVVIDYFSI